MYSGTVYRPTVLQCHGGGHLNGKIVSVSAFLLIEVVLVFFFALQLGPSVLL